ncbi:hypothetical protein DKX38_022716 [Salix brachista]|uniref:H(+)-exporting diphosphatase n=2 Tax=Salix TaxID=40685 RepID=A0A5N5KBN7_9ROSI|nr:hypothetical protein DKX38_022713 [Salix brachista]KAB5524967.1 hypothetical protein DKX38_022716 [Salix brachista]
MLVLPTAPREASSGDCSASKLEANCRADFAAWLSQASWRCCCSAVPGLEFPEYSVLVQGGELPQGSEDIHFPVDRRVNSSHEMMIDDDVETGSMGPYQERPRIFPNMRSKPYNPLICVPIFLECLKRINVRVLFILLLLGFGGISYIGARTSPIMVFVFAVCIFSFLLSIYLTKWVLSKDEGPPEMVQISDAVRDGAEGFFRAQYSTISKMALLLAVVILCIYLLRSTTPQQESSGLGRSTSACITVAAFLLGALCSGVAGYVGMWVSVRANVRVSSAARRAAREALQQMEAVSTFLHVFVKTEVCSCVSYNYAGGVSCCSLPVPLLLVGCGFGASFVALFAQLGGGIYTKAADVGADLVGRVEQGIPEDDPRNPAVIADLVGDNVGDCAARGADLFESIEHVETGQSSTHSDGLNSRHVDDGYISWKPIYRVIDSPGRITEADALSTDKSRLQVQSDYMVCVLQWKNSDPIAVLQQFVHACCDLLSGKSDVNMFAQELCSALDWTMNHCFSIQDKKHFDWDESRSGCKAESVASNGHHNYFEKDGCHQSTIKLREDLINIDSEKRDLELENQKSCCEELEATCLELQLQLESMTKKEIPSSEHHREESQLWTDWEMTAASEKLAECQETILNLGKQLKTILKLAKNLNPCV